MATSGRRKQPKSPAPPIDLEEIEQDPGFRGMLSFLEVSPAERGNLMSQRAEVDSTTGSEPMGETPLGLSSTGLQPTDFSAQELLTEEAVTQPPPARLPSGEPPTGDKGEQPIGFPPVGLPPRFIPYMEVEGRGRRPLRFCHTAQDGHTASEQLTYQALWNQARRFGRFDASGSVVLDIGLSQLCSLLNTDHKNVKRLLGSLQEKLAIDVVRQPDYRLAIPTRYRIFTTEQIMERRRQAGMIWVIRTRTIRFVDLATVDRLVREQSMDDPPMGD